jgi:hypothetical protein
MADYKESYLQELEAAQKQRDHFMEVFLDASRPIPERLAAFSEFGTFDTEQHVQEALQIFRDVNQDENLRAAALQGLIGRVSNDEALMDETIAMLQDTSAPAVLKQAALMVLQASSFSSPIFPDKRPAYLNALRKAVDKDDPVLKQAAMEYLALSNDGYIQRRLVEGLNDPKKEITKPEVAVQLLSYDLHADHFPILRKIAENPPNARAKKEALRNLGADPGSKDLLLRTLQNPNEDPEVRHACAVALEALNPGTVQSYAKDLVLDQSEDEELKAAMLNTITYSSDPGALNDRGFENKLDDAKEQRKSPALKKMYTEYKTVAQQNRSKK